jgi:hypothetical protein
LISLGFAHFGFLVTLGQNFCQRSTNNGTLELLGLACLLLCQLFFLTLLVLAPVKDFLNLTKTCDGDV